MIIKKLELQGFKSFPEKTKIIFHPGITAVIGPNGTGKSNIVDALLWVLGGKTFKALRGERSEDIIFNGNTKKPALSMADVSLYLGDDDEEELIINHRFFRSRESEYRLNGKIARLRDIQEYLWKKAIGEKEYFVIEQGSIDLFLSSKPKEKRLLLEEAAGTAYYKDKKRQAQNKLENSEQNLTRLEDIICEVSKVKNSLKRQAKAAIRYRKLKEKIQHLTSLHFRKKIERLEKNIEETTLQYKNFLNKEKQIISRIKKEEKSLTVKRKKTLALEKTFREEQENLFGLKSDLSRIEADKEKDAKRIDFLQEKKKGTKKIIEEFNQELTLLEKERIEAAETLKTLNQTLKQKQKAFKGADQVSQISKKKLANWQKRLDELRNKYLKKLSEHTEMKNEDVKVEKELELILRQEKKLKSQLAKEQNLLNEKQKKLEQVQTELARSQKLIKEEREALTFIKKAVEEIFSSIEDLQSKAAELKGKKEEGIHHLRALEKMKEQERGSDAVKNIPEAFGLFADLIESDADHAHLIDVFWKEEAKATLLQAKDFLKNLTRRELKGNFLLLHPQKKEEPLSKLYHDERVMGRLKFYVQPSPKIKNILSHLQEAAIVIDIKSAIQLWLRFPSSSYITPQGDFLLSSGLMKLGARKEGIFVLTQEIKKLKGKIALIDKKISPLSLQIKEKIEEKQKQEIEIDQKSEDIAQLERKIEEKEKEKVFDLSENEKIKANISVFKSELKVLIDDKETMDYKMKTISRKIVQLEEEENTLKKTLEREERELATYQKESEREKNRFFEFKSSIDLLQEKIKNLNYRLQSLRHRKETLNTKISSSHKDIQSWEKEQLQLEKNIDSFSKNIKRLKLEKRQKEGDLTATESHLEKIQNEQKETESRIETLREDYELRKEDRVKWEIRKAERERDLFNLEESCWQELKKNLQEVKEEIPEKMIQDEEIEEKLSEAKEKLQKFKAVNLTAEEEYLIQKKRYDFLFQQKRDLRESIDTTKEAIKKIDQESKSQFLRALTEVNKHFQEVFSHLFNGGSAELKLTDPSNPLESGVEINAQPPGKKFQSLSLLSGGERSLTSLAFFFALFRYKPTPFCVLDEVDAALDDVNLMRFLNLMKKIKNQTQFILITHNFKSMEVADYIYGTTMAEPNITSLYSVKLEKKEAS